MTEPRLCPNTLRWAAQHIRKFIGPAVSGAHDNDSWDYQVAANARRDAYEFAAESVDNWATEAELAEAKRKADPGCTCSPSPGALEAGLKCPSCVALDELANEGAEAYQKKFDVALAASLKAAETTRNSDTTREPLWDPAWAGPLLTIDQDKVDEHYGRINYEAQCMQGEAQWENLFSMERLAWTRAAKAVCNEMAKAMKAVRGGP